MTNDDTTASGYAADWSERARRLTFVFLALSLLVGAVVFLPLLSATMMALIIAYGLHFPTRWLIGTTGMSHGLATGIVFVLFLVIAVTLVIAAGIPLIGSLQDFIGGLISLADDIDQFLRQYTPDQGWLVDGAGNRLINFNFILEPLSDIIKRDEIPEEFRQFTSFVAARLLGAAGSVGNFLLLTLFVLTLALYMILELPMAFRWLRALSAPHRRELAILLERSNTIWGRYLYGMIVVALIGAAFTFAQLFVMGIRDAVFLTVLSSVLYLIPIFGGYIAGIVVFFGALNGGSTWIQVDGLTLAIITWIIFSIIQGGFVNSVLAPRIFGKSADFPVTIIIIGLVIFIGIGGFMGALLAVPAMGILREIYVFLVRKMRGGDPFPNEPEPAFAVEPNSGEL